MNKHLPQTFDAKSTTAFGKYFEGIRNDYKCSSQSCFSMDFINLSNHPELSLIFPCVSWGRDRSDPPFSSGYKCPVSCVVLPSILSCDALCPGEGISHQLLLHCWGSSFPRGQVVGWEIQQRVLLLLWGPSEEAGAQRVQCGHPQQSGESRLQPRHQRSLLCCSGQPGDIPAERVYLDIAQAGKGSLSLVNWQSSDALHYCQVR